MVLIVIGCAPRAIVIKPIAPAVQHLHEKAVDVHKSAARTQKSAVEVEQSNSALGNEIDQAAAQAAKLAESGTATKSQLNAQWMLLTDIQARHTIFNSQTKSLAVSAADTAALSGQAVAETAAVQNDATTYDKGVVKIEKVAASQEKYAERGKVVTFMFWFAGLCLLVGLVLWVVGKFSARAIIP
jgi:hypothetical protein